MKRFIARLALGSLCTASSAFTPAMASTEDNTQIITRTEQHQYINAPASNFTGQAQFARFPLLPSSGNVAPAVVSFEANTITRWHTHPHGQYLIVTEGEGRTQEWGKPIQVLHKGDVVWCPPGVKHWHGASESSPMTHIAISPVSNDGKAVTWLEKVELPTASSSKPNLPGKLDPVVLTEQQLSLIPIAAYTATGHLEKLKPALVNGLERGLTVNQIKEVFAHQYAYVGFPRALNGMLTLRALLEERTANGIHDNMGALPTDLPTSTDYYQQGNKTLAYLNQVPVEQVSGPLFNNFSPTVDHALKAHLFGYLFSRDNLPPLYRELVVVSSLSALGDVNAQLRSHLRIATTLGVDTEQMDRVFAQFEEAMGSDLTANAKRVLRELK
ncbi:carboxymuconolactone decarboxylase [Vibrio natriegens]|uniref:cupin domain-containing carboxymuconolactone decarboxylase family protein n=1 Tax=Vibrio natriegens TaxID=691 RepID=UPI000803F10C|nr:carboxymuconolactone decarboxylase family protein [Vibrio natriegens]ANQ25146.1 carboxymuconolactone decarboxylase [Vibrio natriegens]